MLHAGSVNKQGFLRGKKMWYILGFEASIALKPGIEASFDRLRVPFQ